GRFRQDLYYRLNVIQIALPSLRDRLDDLPLICEQLLRRMSAESGSPYVPMLGDGALQALSRYRFPGNARALENLLHRAVALSGGHTIEAEDLGLPAQPADPLQPPTPQGTPAPATQEPLPGASAAATPATPPVAGTLPTDLAAYLDQIERDILVRALDKHR